MSIQTLTDAEESSITHSSTYNNERKQLIVKFSYPVLRYGSLTEKEIEKLDLSTDEQEFLKTIDNIELENKRGVSIKFVYCLGKGLVQIHDSSDFENTRTVNKKDVTLSDTATKKAELMTSIMRKSLIDSLETALKVAPSASNFPSGVFFTGYAAPLKVFLSMSDDIGNDLRERSNMCLAAIFLLMSQSQDPSLDSIFAVSEVINMQRVVALLKHRGFRVARSKGNRSTLTFITKSQNKSVTEMRFFKSSMNSDDEEFTLSTTS